MFQTASMSARARYASHFGNQRHAFIVDFLARHRHGRHRRPLKSAGPVPIDKSPVDGFQSSTRRRCRQDLRPGQAGTPIRRPKRHCCARPQAHPGMADVPDVTGRRHT